MLKDFCFIRKERHRKLPKVFFSGRDGKQNHRVCLDLMKMARCEMNVYLELMKVARDEINIYLMKVARVPKGESQLLFAACIHQFSPTNQPTKQPTNDKQLCRCKTGTPYFAHPNFLGSLKTNKYTRLKKYWQ